MASDSPQYTVRGDDVIIPAEKFKYLCELLPRIVRELNYEREPGTEARIAVILAVLMSIAMQMEALTSKGEDYLVLVLYVVLIGLTLIQSGSMIVDLTAKDKLSKRIELFAASGMPVKEIIQKYSIQIFRLSSIIPFLVFMSCYYFND